MPACHRSFPDGGLSTSLDVCRYLDLSYRGQPGIGPGPRNQIITAAARQLVAAPVLTLLFVTANQITAADGRPGGYVPSKDHEGAA